MEKPTQTTITVISDSHKKLDSLDEITKMMLDKQVQLNNIDGVSNTVQLQHWIHALSF